MCRRLYLTLYLNKSPEPLLAVSRIEGPAIWAVLRPCDVGKGVDAVGIDAQGLPVFSSRLFRVIHRYTSSADAKGHQKPAKYQYITFHLVFLRCRRLLLI